MKNGHILCPNWLSGHRKSRFSDGLGGYRALLSIEFWKDLPRALKAKGIRGVRELLSFSIKAGFILKELENADIQFDKADIVVYSYWLHLTAYVASVFADKKGIAAKVTRCHRYDLYEEENGGYLPYRHYLINSYKKVCCISEDGVNYLKSRYPYHSSKFFLSRLGTNDHGIQQENNINDKFTIVSCSSITPVKRVERIVGVMSLLGMYPLRWIHFGDGNDLQTVKRLADEKLLGTSIEFHFAGRLSNKDILDYYENNYVHCFINVSSSEGVPVSIMEAMSFSIPIIATSVGGTAEIVVNGVNGIVVRKEFTDDECAKAIVEILDLWKNLPEIYQRYRKCSRQIWESECDSKKNYPRFLGEILED